MFVVVVFFAPSLEQQVVISRFVEVLLIQMCGRSGKCADELSSSVEFVDGLRQNSNVIGRQGVQNGRQRLLLAEIGLT